MHRNVLLVFAGGEEENTGEGGSAVWPVRSGYPLQLFLAIHFVVAWECQYRGEWQTTSASTGSRGRSKRTARLVKKGLIITTSSARAIDKEADRYA